MANKKFKFVLASVSTVSAAFFAGKYYEKNVASSKIYISAQPTIFTSVPQTSESSVISTVIDKLWPKNFGLLKAAEPITEPTLVNPHANRVSQIMRYGFPGLDNVISYKDYVVSYDRRNRVAHWVLEHLTAESIKKNDKIDRSKCSFKEETGLHPYFRSQNSDYKGSGYDRGHLAAAGNHKIAQELVDETFFLTNIAPQVGAGFNRDSWNRLEKYVRKLTKFYPNVYCCTGPLYLPRKESNGKTYVKYEVIGSNHVAVPTHFFKVVLGEKRDGTLEMECYVMENAVIKDDIPLDSFRVPLQTIERAAGLLFFDQIVGNRVTKVNGQKFIPS